MELNLSKEDVAVIAAIIGNYTNAEAVQFINKYTPNSEIKTKALEGLINNLVSTFVIYNTLVDAVVPKRPVVYQDPKNDRYYVSTSDYISKQEFEARNPTLTFIYLIP